MFVGHYAAGFLLKKVDKTVSLGMLFLAVQFVDILFFPFVMLGIEHFKFVPNFTASTHFDLYYMPYTHSLAGSFFWALVVYLAYKFLPLKTTANKATLALIMAGAVLSHWFLDLVVHTPDLPLLGDNSPKLGFGIWNSAIATFLLESVLLAGAYALYMKETRPVTASGKYAMGVFVAVMLLINANNIFGEPMAHDVTSLSVTALAAYFIFAGVAFWLDKKRA